MDLGFETIGNACLIFHDGGPRLIADPWLVGDAYFGSWSLSHEVPAQQLQAAKDADYVWISHGHPDHLSPASLELLRGKPILLPDHYGGRIADGLREDGHEVRILKDGEWFQVSDRLRVTCVGDVFQDAVLMADLDGTLVVDSNDASDRGVGWFIREQVAKAKRSYLACLTGYGDADLISFRDEDGNRVVPQAAQHEPPGPGIAGILRFYGIDTYAPSSTMHRYQRSDSAWANDFTTPVEDFAIGFEEADDISILPAFVRVDLARDAVEEIAPREVPAVTLPCEQFGDDWSEELEPSEVAEIRDYFGAITHLEHALGYVRFRVGGREHTIDIAPKQHDRGVTFEAPRGSLLTSIRYRIFDDLLISNFATATLHGDWATPPEAALYPDFTPFVAKYGDNGGARTEAELRAYFREYESRGFFDAGPTPFSQLMYGAIERYL